MILLHQCINTQSQALSYYTRSILSNNSNSYYNNGDVNLESDSYTILEDSFVVERRDRNSLFIKLNENVSGDERVMRIVIEAGNYFDYVYIKQAASE